MNEIKKFAQQLLHARQTPEYWTELAKQEFAEGIRRVMGEMQQNEFAEKLGGKSEVFVSRLLAGEYNFTLRKMNEIACLLDAAVHVYVAKKNVVLRWSALEGGRPTAQFSKYDSDVDAEESDLQMSVVSSAGEPIYSSQFEALGSSG